jgi:hypothetical protein
MRYRPACRVSAQVCRQGCEWWIHRLHPWLILKRSDFKVSQDLFRKAASQKKLSKLAHRFACCRSWACFACRPHLGADGGLLVLVVPGLGAAPGGLDVVPGNLELAVGSLAFGPVEPGCVLPGTVA